MNKFREAAGRVEPTPLTRDRVAAALGSMDCQFGRDEDGDCFGNWDGHTFRFFCVGNEGEIFTVRSFWNPEPPLDMQPQVLQELNQWHGERIWPKAYVNEYNSKLIISAEHSVDYEHGLTDNQLIQHLQCAINTMIGLFEHLETRFDQWEQWVSTSPEEPHA